MITSIIVQPGTTLFRLASDYLGDATQWARIALINRIQDPFIIAAPIVVNVPASTSDPGERDAS